MKRGQAAIEYMMLIALVLVLVLPLTYYASGRTNSEVRGNKAFDAVQSIAQAADSASVYGPGTITYVWITIPTGVVSQSVINNNLLLTIGLFGNTSDYTASTKTNLTGAIPTNSGRHKVKLTVLENRIIEIQ